MFDWDDVPEELGGPNQRVAEVRAPVEVQQEYESEEEEEEEEEEEDEGGLASLLCLDENYKKRKPKPKPKPKAKAAALTAAGEDRAALRRLRIGELKQRLAKSGIKVPPDVVEKDDLVSLLLGHSEAQEAAEPTRPAPAEPEPPRKKVSASVPVEPEPPRKKMSPSVTEESEPASKAVPRGPDTGSSAASRTAQKKPAGKRYERMAAEVDQEGAPEGGSSLQNSLKQQFQRMKEQKRKEEATRMKVQMREEAERQEAAARLEVQDGLLRDTPGSYLITKKTQATARADRGGGKVDELLPGQIVEVLEVAESEGRVRGRIADPPCWFSIINNDSGTRFAQKETPQQRPKPSSTRKAPSKFAAFSKVAAARIREESPEPPFEPPPRVEEPPPPPAKPSPLAIAAKTGSLKKVMSVLQAGAVNVNAGGPRGETALFAAVASDSVDVTAALLLHSADPSKKSDAYVTAKDVAKPGAVKMLLELASGNVEAGAMQAVVKVLDPLLRPQITHMLQERMQAQFMAEEKQRWEGGLGPGGAAAMPSPAAPAAARAPGRAPAREEPQQPPRALAQEPAKPGTESALTRASKGGNLKEVMRLLQGGADPNSADAVGETPLFEAAAHGYADVTAALLVYRGDPERRSGTGLLAGDLTTDGSVRCLLAFFRGEDMSSEQLEFLLEGLGETMREIIGRMVRSLEASKRGLANGEVGDEAPVIMPPRDRVIDTAHLSEAPLAVAARAGDIDEVRMLLEVRADANSRDDLGETPLFEAVASGFNDVTALLLLHNADPNKRSDAGGVPADIAADLPGKLLLDFFKGIEISNDDKHVIIHGALQDEEVRDAMAGRFRAQNMQEAYKHTLRKLRA